MQLGAYYVVCGVSKRQVPCHAMQAAPPCGSGAMHATIIQPNWCQVMWMAKKYWSSQNRIAGSEVGCQSSSFRLWPLPRPEGSLEERAGKNKEWTEPYPWKWVGHHNPDHSQPWDTTYLQNLRRSHTKQWKKEKKHRQKKINRKSSQKKKMNTYACK